MVENEVWQGMPLLWLGVGNHSSEEVSPQATLFLVPTRKRGKKRLGGAMRALPVADKAS